MSSSVLSYFVRFLFAVSASVLAAGGLVVMKRDWAAQYVGVPAGGLSKKKKWLYFQKRKNKKIKKATELLETKR